MLTHCNFFYTVYGEHHPAALCYHFYGTVDNCPDLLMLKQMVEPKYFLVLILQNERC